MKDDRIHFTQCMQSPVRERERETERGGRTWGVEGVPALAERSDGRRSLRARRQLALRRQRTLSCLFRLGVIYSRGSDSFEILRTRERAWDFGFTDLRENDFEQE